MNLLSRLSENINTARSGRILPLMQVSIHQIGLHLPKSRRSIRLFSRVLLFKFQKVLFLAAIII